MGTDEQDTMRGRALRERKEASEELKLIEQKAQEIGAGLVAIGAALQSGQLLDRIDTQSMEETRLEVRKTPGHPLERHLYPKVEEMFEMIRKRRELEGIVQKASDILKGYEIS